MTADEILKALEESEGFYLEVGDWVISSVSEEEGREERWSVTKYLNPLWSTSLYFDTLAKSLEYALRDGKP